MMNLNLLPSKAKFQAAKIKLRQKISKLIVVIVVFWSALYAVVLVIDLYTKIRLDSSLKRLVSAQNSYASMSDDISFSQKIRYQAKVVGGVLDSRFEYGKAFETVQKLFPEGIKIVKNDLRDDGMFVVDGIIEEKKNIDLLELLIIDINQGNNVGLKNAQLKSLDYKKPNWSFTMEVSLK